MIDITQDITKLTLHANFEYECNNGRASATVVNFCALVRKVAPDFFTSNDAFETYYYDDYSDHTDLDLMVHALKAVHTQMLIIDHNEGIASAMDYYFGNLIDADSNFRDRIDSVLEGLLHSTVLVTQKKGVAPIEEPYNIEIVGAV